MKNYRVMFYRVEKEKAKTSPGQQEQVVTSDEVEYLGTVVVDDCGVGKNFTIQAKAFKRAPIICLNANKTRVEEI